jgi:hypothetical protein
MVALSHMRPWLADHEKDWAFAKDIAQRLWPAEDTKVTAQEYVRAITIADAYGFIAAKLAMLYFGIAHSIPLHRLHPATAERDAIELWWPWGRPAQLIAAGPAVTKARAPKAVLDPAIITTKRPHNVVREVIERTGIDRTTPQRMTAELRADMRQKRFSQAWKLLQQGETLAAVARAVDLSPSRISAMFKGKTFPTKRLKRNHTGSPEPSVASRQR